MRARSAGVFLESLPKKRPDPGSKGNDGSTGGEESIAGHGIVADKAGQAWGRL